MASQTLTTCLRGHCLCGACSYTLDPSIPIKSDSFIQTFGDNFYSCYDHCSHCRRATASLATAYLIVPTEFLVWSEGSEAHLKTYLSSGGDVERKFCGDCGTPLTFYNHSRAAKHADCIDVTIASLADEDLARLEELGIAPTQTHCWWGSGVEWYKRECLRDVKGNGVTAVWRNGSSTVENMVDLDAELEKAKAAATFAAKKE